MANAKLIAVMGVTGTGKSSFIRLVTGDESIKVGETLESGELQIGCSMADLLADNDKKHMTSKLISSDIKTRQLS